MFIFAGFIALLVILVDLTQVQNYLARKASTMLAEKLHTKVSITHVRIDFLNHVLIQGLYIEDKQHDTLLYAGEARVRITDWFIFVKKPVLKYIGLHNAKVHLYRTPTSKEWNYQFIADAFSTNATKKTTKKQAEFEFDLQQADLQSVHFHMDDAWRGEDMDYDIGSLALDAHGLDFKKKTLDISSLDISGAIVSIQEYPGGRPPRPKTNTPDPFDSTAFNTDKWKISAKEISLKGCAFNLKSDDDTPMPNAFDPQHIYIKNINIDVSHAYIIGDTIHGNIDMLSAQDRSGLAIKKMKSKVTVSPIASICDNLYLETNNSKLHGYYAMLYKHFPDFTSYITNVVMETRLKDAVVDERDVAYFAPILRNYPTVLHVTGSAKGTVADLYGQNLFVTDGNTIIKGNIRMTGLPDIYKTYIKYDNGDIFTTGAGLMRYAPSLKNDPNFDLGKIMYAYFKGSYTGYIENFAVNGNFNTNLGVLTTNVKMNIPGFKADNAIYSGTITGDKINLGTFLRQPNLNLISLNGNINGNGFDPQHAQIKFDGTVSEFDFNGYPYQKIDVEGTIEHKKFNGKLQVDDPNLALAFNGTLDYSQKELSINATANLLKSDFRALKFTTDTITADADFDVNFTGNNIDNFSGYAKLFNIDVKRNQHRLDLDSIYMHVSENDGKKTLSVESNDIVAKIEGQYQLSKLPYSVQYYLSGYIPNYIKPPSKTAPEQNLTFSVTSKNVDSLLSVTFPLFKGFNNSSISGSLNTISQKLTLNAQSPYGSIGNFHLSNISITGDGNFNTIGLNVQVDTVAIGDTFLSGSLSVTTTLGNDSLGFNIATSSPDANSSATINGRAYARRDSIFLALLPSQFYLNQARWDIPAGNEITYSTNYLYVKGLVLQSGLQKISANTAYSINDQSLSINTENLDLGQLGSWAGLAMYQPDGRVNGSIKIDNLFKTLYVSANLKATGLQFGTDTVGTVDIIGSYDGAKKLVSLDPQTGIFGKNASITASGNISLDTTKQQAIDGNIQFNNAPVVWLSPFLIGFISNLAGTLNGTISFTGNSSAPNINGDVALADAAMHIDFLGTSYTVPKANINVTERRINIGQVAFYDKDKNKAILSGHFSHNFFKNMQMHLTAKTDKFEVINLHDYENQIFYGNLVAGMDSLTIRGPFNDISFNIYNATPAAKSHLYFPVNNTSNTGSYSYVSFKTYGKNEAKQTPRNKNKLNINIEGKLNDLASLTLILDQSTGDAITAKGSGYIRLEIPANNDVRMFGSCDIDDGDYTYTFKQLSIIRKFNLNQGSAIQFNGLIGQTSMDVNATFTAPKVRLYDLLSDAEKSPVTGVLTTYDQTDAQTPQDVNVLLHMTGTLKSPKLTFNVDLADNHSQGTYAYTKLQRINQDDQQLLDQVASLLLIGDFIPPEGLGNGSSAVSGAINNVSQVISGTASTQLTNLVSRLSKDKNLSVDLKYVNYSLDPTLGGLNRNQFTFNVRKNYLHDRLIVEVGSTSDWGHPASTSASSNFNFTGDFRVQYLLTQSSGLRLNVFRTSDYDVTLDRDITRSGAGISWRKTFNDIPDFFHGNTYAKKQQQLIQAADTTNTAPPSKTSGTD